MFNRHQPSEIDRIIARAVEIATPEREHLTWEQTCEAAAEVGIPKAAMEQARVEIRGKSKRPAVSKPLPPSPEEAERQRAERAVLVAEWRQRAERIVEAWGAPIVFFPEASRFEVACKIRLCGKYDGGKWAWISQTAPYVEDGTWWWAKDDRDEMGPGHHWFGWYDRVPADYMLDRKYPGKNTRAKPYEPYPKQPNPREVVF